MEDKDLELEVVQRKKGHKLFVASIVFVVLSLLAIIQLYVYIPAMLANKTGGEALGAAIVSVVFLPLILGETIIFNFVSTLLSSISLFTNKKTVGKIVVFVIALLELLSIGLFFIIHH